MVVKEIFIFVCLVGLSIAFSEKYPEKESDIVTIEDIQKAEARLFPKGDSEVPSERSSRVKRHLFKKKKGKKGRGRVVIVNRYYPSRNKPSHYEHAGSSSEGHYVSRPGGNYHHGISHGGKYGGSGESYEKPYYGGSYGGSGERYVKPYGGGGSYGGGSGEIFGGAGGYHDKRNSKYSNEYPGEGIFYGSSERVEYGDGGFAHYGGDRFNPGRPVKYNIQTLPKPISPLSQSGSAETDSVELYDVLK